MGLEDNTKGVFSGATLADVKVTDVRKMIDGLPVKKSTKRHHREAFHNLFEFAMKYSYYTPTNFRYPNPLSALPSCHEKNRRIVFLKNVEVDRLLELLEPYPSVRIAAALMIYAGLRRAEMLWLTSSVIDPALRYMSIVNKTDDEKDLESTLKTGERGVPILPPLKALLESYLPSLKSDSVVPSPRGMQWDGDNFGDRHRTILRNNHLEWTCLIYRHTFATKRAAEGWSLFRIAKVMGNSVAVCEQHYAAYIDRSRAYE